VLAASIAGSLTDLSRRLVVVGRHEDALTVITEAVELYRELAADRPDEFGPSLADSLNELAGLLARLGRLAEAEAVEQEASLFGGASAT
jgi:hypothetical protein